MADPKVINSPLSGTFTEGSITVDVQIYRLENTTKWSLEVIDSEGTSIVWTDLFDTELRHTDWTAAPSPSGIFPRRLSPVSPKAENELAVWQCPWTLV